MEPFGISITLLAGVLTYLAWRNGRWMKQAHQDAMTLLKQIGIGQEETRKEATEARREVAEAIKYVSNLIVSEGEKTRAVIQK